MKPILGLSDVFFFVLVIDFPVIRFGYIIDFPLHVLKKLILHRSKFFLHFLHIMVAYQQHIKPDKLPFSDAFGLFDGRKWVAFKGFVSFRPDLAKFAITTLDHIGTPIYDKKVTDISATLGFGLLFGS